MDNHQFGVPHCHITSHVCLELKMTPTDSYMHAHSRTHACARTHARTYARTHPHMHARTSTHEHTNYLFLYLSISHSPLSSSLPPPFVSSHSLSLIYIWYIRLEFVKHFLRSKLDVTHHSSMLEY